MKLAVLGGGGVRSPFLSKSLALAAKDIGLTELVFMDIDKEKLFSYGKIAKRVANALAPEVKFTLTLDAEEALRDADYIITTIRSGGDRGRVIDERTALNHGVLGQETTGAGGFAMALRSIPVLKDYCLLAQKVSKKDALIFNFTNPSGLVTQALRTMGFSNVYGVCDAPSSFFIQLGDMLSVQNLRGKCFGLNHLSWFYDFEAEGKDVTASVKAHPCLHRDTEMRLFPEELLKINSGFLPNEYLYFYYYRDRAVESVLKSGKTRGETILEINEQMQKTLATMDIDQDFDAAFECFAKAYAARENSYFAIESGEKRTQQVAPFTFREFLEKPENGSYAGVALDFIRARQGAGDVHMVMSLPNEGALDFLAPEDVCELSCTVTKDAVLRDKAPEVPTMLKNLILTVKNYENLTVEAILKKDKTLAVQALTLHPLVGSYPLAKSLVEEYLTAYKAYIGEWT